VRRDHSTQARPSSEQHIRPQGEMQRKKDGWRRRVTTRLDFPNGSLSKICAQGAPLEGLSPLGGSGAGAEGLRRRGYSSGISGLLGRMVLSPGPSMQMITTSLSSAIILASLIGSGSELFIIPPRLGQHEYGDEQPTPHPRGA
jgi:hypothetical protein